MFVEDHCEALDCVFHEGDTGETYNIGGCNEWSNIDIVRYLCRELDKKLKRSGVDSCENLITFVKDRPGHDQRYALNSGKVRQLGWQPAVDTEESMRRTIQWYVDNESWWRDIKASDDYLAYYKRQYGERLK